MHCVNCKARIYGDSDYCARCLRAMNPTTADLPDLESDGWYEQRAQWATDRAINRSMRRR